MPDNLRTITIDHRYYPDIIDTILSYLDFEGLKAASSAADDWQDIAERVKDRLAFIEIAHYDSKGGKVIPYDPNVDHWRTQYHLALFVRRDRNDPDSRELFHLVRNKKDALDPYLLELFENYVTIVEIPQMDFNSTQWAILRTLIESVPVVRCLSHEGRDLQVLNQKTLVIHQNANAHRPCDPWHMEPTFTGRGELFYPEHIVINLDCYANPVNEADGMTNFYDDGVEPENRYLTVILHDKMSQPTEFTGFNSRLIVGYMATVLWHRAKVVTIVGLEAFVPEGTLDQFAHAAITDVYQDTYDFYNQAEIPLRWRFYTHEEYKKLVGEEVYEAHVITK